MTNYSGEPLAVVVADDLSDDFDYSNGEIKVNFPAQQDTSVYALKNGDANEPFKVKDATNADEAVNKGQLDAAIAGNNQDTSVYALKNGDANEPFKVKDATNDNEALSKGQLLSEIKFVDGSGSGIDADLVRGLPADFTSNKTVNGYQKLPSGLIFQWGEVSHTNTNANVGDYTDVTFTFPISFPNNTLSVVCTNKNADSEACNEGNENTTSIMSYDTQSVVIRLLRVYGSTESYEEVQIKVLAIGY